MASPEEPQKSENAGGGKSGGSADDKGGGGDAISEPFEYYGWVYHLGSHKIDFFHRRFLWIRGSYLQMFKRDPHEHHGTKPIRRGYVGHTLMAEELGRRKINHDDAYVLRFYNRLDASKKGEIACATAEEAKKWMEAFDRAKRQVEYDLSKGGNAIKKLNEETEIDLQRHRRHRRRVTHYARGLKKLIRRGQGQDNFLRPPIDSCLRVTGDLEGDAGDVIEAHEWKCVRTVNGGVRIFEDVAGHKNGKGVLVKAVGVIDSSAESVFEVVLNLDREQRYEWDILTGDLELVDSLNEHYDVVYGTYDPRYLTRWTSKRDFIFSRQWFRGQDGTFTILQFPAVHKKRPQKSGYRRTKINPSTWEIRNINSSSVHPRCLVTQMLEINAEGWFGWKNNQSSKFEKSVPYALLCQVSGLRAYIGARSVHEAKTAVMDSKGSGFSSPNGEEFHDAVGTDSSSSSSSSDDDDSDDEVELNSKGKVNLDTDSLAIENSAADAIREFFTSAHPIAFDPHDFQGSMRLKTAEADRDCWSSPDGSGFMIRGKTYRTKNDKIAGGDPLLKLIAVDWLKVDHHVDNIALHPSSLVQSEAGKKLPFILVLNLEVPARPNYSLVLYFAAERPVKENSLLGRFVDGTDEFRDSRFKLIPSVNEGYWMVKRAVGTKACLLGKAVTCRYLRRDNFLEIDVDIGSSPVARSVVGLVLGYVTSLIVDLAILIEGHEEEELPESILGTVRLIHVRPDSAVPLKD
ncbi:protein ENHANCED DISEASE RESISTANCE 2-like [Heracleum sosnowskyi]|uniref:Protein ENHANCED DISEASE RESISTANCE 2-like n=1 Tax=Heracleum sosnowskyi TaxID=360622 RepID=A0AAD8J1G1_9APIA|nr:protein ENHANCED DISEASE RESISTANCE 2-like [Heracleum sosnowskyi]